MIIWVFLWLPAPKKKLSPKDVVDDLIADDEVESPAMNPKLDYKRIIMGKQLSDMEINFAQWLLKGQHPLW